MFEDRSLVCRECGQTFVFTASEQALYAQLGFDNAPMRCGECRSSAKALAAAVKPKRITYAAVCCACGKETQLPFKPTGEKPVYCSECFAAQKGKA